MQTPSQARYFAAYLQPNIINSSFRVITHYDYKMQLAALLALAATGLACATPVADRELRPRDLNACITAATNQQTSCINACANNDSNCIQGWCVHVRSFPVTSRMEC
jgi:hypothetical protein